MERFSARRCSGYHPGTINWARWGWEDRPLTSPLPWVGVSHGGSFSCTAEASLIWPGALFSKVLPGPATSMLQTLVILHEHF